MRTTNAQRNRWHKLTLAAAIASLSASTVVAQDANDDEPEMEEIVVLKKLRIK